MNRVIGRHEVGSKYKKAAQSRRENLEHFKIQAEGLNDTPLLTLLCNTAARATSEERKPVTPLKGPEYSNTESTRMQTLLDVIYNRVVQGGINNHPEFKPLVEKMASLKGTDGQDNLLVALTVKELLNERGAGPVNPWASLVLKH